MTTTPLPPTDWVSMLKDAIGIVKGKPTYKRFIDGTPLNNDVPVWMADFAMQHATQASADLEAENQRLREALEELLRHFTRSPSSLADSETRIKAHAALESKP